MSQKALASFVGTNRTKCIAVGAPRTDPTGRPIASSNWPISRTSSKNGNVKIKGDDYRLNELDATAFEKLKLEKAKEWKEAA
jgi:hypothetical protein